MRLNKNAEEILAARYLHEGETPDDMVRRVVNHVAQHEKDDRFKPLFTDMIDDLRFLPNTPTLINSGKPASMLSGCFVLPIEDSMKGILKSMEDMAMIQKYGGGTGFSFSRLRPEGDTVSKTRGVSSGPISFMIMYDAVTNAIKQGGARRGANMGILHVSHPDIESFIECKRKEGVLANFNISVALTDEFMAAVKSNGMFPLVNPRNGEVVREVDAKSLFHKIAENAWASGDPGIFFIDRTNAANPIRGYKFESTNPCGEQPLFPYESCNLGSLNLRKYIHHRDIQWDKLAEDVDLAVRFLDDVIDGNVYPTQKIHNMTHKFRKIGLGVMGWADTLVMMEVPYDSWEALHIAGDVMEFISDHAYTSSVALGEEKGPFPGIDVSKYDDNIRNAARITIAPTGSISLIAGCSSGIEPYYRLAYEKMAIDKTIYMAVDLLPDTLDAQMVANAGGTLAKVDAPDWMKKLFKTSLEIDPEWHISMQSKFQEFTDNAVSKTINMPNDVTVEDVEKAFWLAYEMGCKGVTIYRDGSKKIQAQRSMTLQERPDVIPAEVRKVNMGCGSLYITTGHWGDHEIKEIFVALGKSGGCVTAYNEALSRLVSIALRSGVQPSVIVKQLKGIRCPNSGLGNYDSCLDAIAKTIEEITGVEVKVRVSGYGQCPDCGAELYSEEGCQKCTKCNYSKCG